MKQISRKLKLFIFLLGFPVLMFSQSGNIKGRVFNHKNNEPIPFANVIIDGKLQQGATTDVDGNFSITRVSPGYVRLIATYVGFKRYISEDFLVTNAHIVKIDIPMDEEAVSLDVVEVKPSVITRKDESPVAMQTLSIQEIEKSPGANRDISKVIQSLPGVATTVSYRNDVIVRGGGPNENRYYLDGIEIPNINHFATQGASGGPVGMINVDFIREIELYTGAFTASRGNVLSSVLEMKQIDGNREKFGGRITLGASDFGLTLDGPITKNSTLLFSVRRSYLQLLFSLLKLPFLPTYNDYQFKYKIDIDKRNQLSFISIGAYDVSKLNTGIKNPDESQRYLLGYLPEYDQWNYACGIVYRHFRAKGYGTWVASRNMLNNEQTKYQANIVNPDSLILKYKSQEIENKFRYEGLTDLVRWKLMYGAGMEYDQYNNTTFQKIYTGNAPVTLNYHSAIDFFRWNLFGQVTRSFFKDRLTLSLGARMDANSYSPRMNNLLNQFSPRFSASYGIVPEKFFLNFNIGRYFELPSYTTLGYRNSAGSLVNDSLGIKYISADHLVLGLEWLPRANSKLSVEGFYKYYRNYPFSVRDSVCIASKGSDFNVVGDEPVIPASNGRAYGLELFYRDADLLGFNVIISYTFVRSEFTNIQGKYIPSAWDNRNLVNFTLGRKFKHNWQLGMKWRFAGGTPYTPYDLDKSSLVSAWDAQNRGYYNYSLFNTKRLSSFNQLDIRVDKGFYFKKWSLMFYIDIQNVLNFKAQQQDYLVNTQPDGSVQKYVDEQGRERYVLREIPSTAGTVLPSVGIMVDF